MPKLGLCFALALSFLLAVSTCLTVAAAAKRDDMAHLQCGGQNGSIEDRPLRGSRPAIGPIGLRMMKVPKALIAKAMLTGNKSRPVGGTIPGVTSSTIVISIGDNQSVTVELIKATTTAEGCTWSGVVRQTGENALIMWWSDGRLTGMFGYKGRIYTIMNTGDEIHAVIEVDPNHASLSKHQSADSRLRTNPEAVHADATAERQHAPVTASTETKPLSNAERRALEAKKITIDLLVVYTMKAARHYNIKLAGLIAQAVDQTNASFRNSGLQNINLRLVHTQAIDYDETNGGHFDHLYRMVDGVGPFKELRILRDEKRADIVGMVIDDPSGCGLSTRVAAGSEEAYFVVHHSCATLAFSIAHEIGHILGARHNRQTDATDSPFPYGHGYVNGKWRDIMSYATSCDGCPRILYWSNPRIKYRGEPTGTDADDNARVILEQAERVARFR